MILNLFHQKKSSKPICKEEVYIYNLFLPSGYERETLNHRHAPREVECSNPDRGTIVGRSFPSNQATGEVFSDE